MDACQVLFGMNDQNIKALEQELSVSIQLQHNQLVVKGEAANRETAETVLRQVISHIQAGEEVEPWYIRQLILLARDNKLDRADEILNDTVAYTHKGRRIVCKTAGQLAFVQAMRSNELTLAIGPAGTGKTYLAVAMAVHYLRAKRIERIILSRPAVEAGEKLGFLPGDMAQKVDPYLRPLYDALYDMMGTDSYQTLVEKGTIEIAPLAFMRGRTLHDAFMILDEAQNTTPEQMKMFLTRMGRNARCVVTGDLTQVDLPNAKQSGLIVAQQVLRDVAGVGVVRLTQHDVVRNELVQRIVAAYERFEQPVPGPGPRQ